MSLVHEEDAGGPRGEAVEKKKIPSLALQRRLNQAAVFPGGAHGVPAVLSLPAIIDISTLLRRCQPGRKWLVINSPAGLNQGHRGTPGRVSLPPPTSVATRPPLEGAARMRSWLG